MGRVVNRTWSRGLTTFAVVALATGAVVIGCANNDPAGPGGEHASVGDVRPDALDVRATEPPVAVAAADPGTPYEPVPPMLPKRPAVERPTVVRQTEAFVTRTPAGHGQVVAAKLTTTTGIDQPKLSSHSTHVVRKGDTLTSIAKAEYGDGRKWKKLAAANPEAAGGMLRIGQRIVIP